MNSAWNFPTSLTVGGVEYKIRTDFRVILDLITALNDPDLYDGDKWIAYYIQSLVTLAIMYPDFKTIPKEHIQEAMEKAFRFIDMGIQNNSKKPKTMDWEQDAAIIIPAINKVLNYEIREQEYVHWWTFLGAYLEIGDSLFSNIIHIRQKKAKGKKLEKWEQEFYKENKSLIDFKQKEKRSNEEYEMLRDYFGYSKK